MDNDSKPLVSIISLTYNHAPYIRECLDGFLMQKTDFQIEVIIHDDASTDGTTDIVKEYAEKYPDIIKPIIQTENQYSKHYNFGFILEKCFCKVKGKYIAYCEGDDFWIDHFKLQKQVDFLESNSDYGFVHTDIYDAYWKNGFQKKIRTRLNIPEGNVYKDILKDNFISTLSVVFKSELRSFLTKEVYPIPYWDRIMWICLSRHTKFHYLPERTSVYRILENSATHGNYSTVLQTEIRGTADLLDYLKRNNMSDEEVKCFLFPRSKKLLKLSYLAKDKKSLLKYWNLINANGFPNMSDYIYWWFGKLNIPILIYNALVNLKCLLIK